MFRVETRFYKHFAATRLTSKNGDEMREAKTWVRDFLRGGISRREFVERAATGGLSLLATTSILSAKAHAEDRRGEIDHRHHHGLDHRHHHGGQRSVASSRQRTWNQTNVNPWEEWLNQENLPVHKDYYVADLRKAEVKPWKRLGPGVNGAYIDLVGGEGVNVGYLCELAPGAKTQPQRYLFEEVLYVLNGEGESLIWNPGSKTKQSVRWRAGSVLAPPLNVWRQHINRGSTPARFLVMTNAPVVIDLFHNLDFVFNNDFAFRDRYSGEADFFGGGELHCHRDRVHAFHLAVRIGRGELVLEFTVTRRIDGLERRAAAGKRSRLGQSSARAEVLQEAVRVASNAAEQAVLLENERPRKQREDQQDEKDDTRNPTGLLDQVAQLAGEKRKSQQSNRGPPSEKLFRLRKLP